MNQNPTESTVPLVRSDAPLSVAELTERVNLVRQVMQNVMRPGVHFGAIPGCGERQALLQPGAEVLGLTFQLAPCYDTEVLDLEGGHREVRVKCTLAHQRTGQVIGQAVRSCSTMEAKYRWRAERVRELPSAYWKTRDANPSKAKEMLGGETFEARKQGGKWYIVQLVEQGNPHDYHNTVSAIACKRAFVAAIRSATAASDIFVEEAVQPDDTPVPDTGATAGEPANDAAEAQTPLQRLRVVIGELGLTEQKAMEWAVKQHLMPDSIATLDELADSKPAALLSILNRIGRTYQPPR